MFGFGLSGVGGLSCLSLWLGRRRVGGFVDCLLLSFDFGGCGVSFVCGVGCVYSWLCWFTRFGFAYLVVWVVVFVVCYLRLDSLASGFVTL